MFLRKIKQRTKLPGVSAVEYYSRFIDVFSRKNRLLILSNIFNGKLPSVRYLQPHGDGSSVKIGANFRDLDGKIWLHKKKKKIIHIHVEDHRPYSLVNAQIKPLGLET